MIQNEVILIFCLSVWVISVFLLLAGIAVKHQWVIQLQGVRHATHVKNLLRDVQQHRGMMGIFLKGDTSYEVKITALRDDISQHFNALAQGLSKNHEQAKKQLDQVETEWRLIQSQCFNYSAAESFKRHCQLIKSILSLLNNLAEHTQLYKRHSYDPEYVKIIWYLLPQAAEALGKARAIGSGIAASGRPTAVDKVNVALLSHKITSAFLNVQQGLNNISEKDATLTSYFVQLDQQLKGFVGNMRSEFLTDRPPTVTAGAFFDQATDKLTALFNAYEYSEEIVKTTLDASLLRTRKQLGFIYAVLCCSGLVLAIQVYLLMS